jgi:ribosomal protein L12E/L44/L45/RPP1/RPP2
VATAEVAVDEPALDDDAAALDELELDELPHAAKATAATSATTPANVLRNSPSDDADNGFSSRERDARRA